MQVARDHFFRLRSSPFPVYARFHALNSGASRSRRPFIDEKVKQANQDQGGKSSDDKLRLKRPFERETRIVIRKEHE